MWLGVDVNLKLLVDFTIGVDFAIIPNKSWSNYDAYLDNNTGYYLASRSRNSAEVSVNNLREYLPLLENELVANRSILFKTEIDCNLSLAY